MLLNAPVPALNAGLILMLPTESIIMKGRLKQHVSRKKIKHSHCFYFGREAVHVSQSSLVLIP